MKIPFNRAYYKGNELKYVESSLASGPTSGDGVFTKKVQSFFDIKYGFRNSLLTTSCTSALEMTALLSNIKPGDEVIIPSFTFVSSANPFILRGAKIIFIDSSIQNPNMDISLIKEAISEKTKAIVVVHYAGIACDIDEIFSIIKGKDIILIEDAAQCFDSFYKGKPLGSFGHFSTFSFHETKNISCGEGGLLVVNDINYINRAKIIREKGTNRHEFLNGMVDKYGWVDIGSSFLPSDILSAVLFAQLEKADLIQNKRKLLWDHYYSNLSYLCTQSEILMPIIPDYATNNAHMFYLVFPNEEMRDRVIKKLKENSITASFHYQSLHKSKFFLEKNKYVDLPYSDRYSKCLLRLPLFYDLDFAQIDKISEIIKKEIKK